MNALAIDTSGKQAGIAIVSDRGIIGEISISARHGEKIWTHSEVLMPGIDSLMQLTRFALHDIELIAYTSGPGSFTGLRIAAACALGLAYALDVPCVPVPTLDALAGSVCAPGAVIIPMTDARRDQVYAAVFRQCGTARHRLSDYMAICAADLVPLLREYAREPIIFTGDGAQLHRDMLHESMPQAAFAPQAHSTLRAACVGQLALQTLSGAPGGAFDHKTPPEILYIRAPQAVRQAAAQ